MPHVRSSAVFLAGVIGVCVSPSASLAQPRAVLRPFSTATEYPMQVTAIRGDSTKLFGVDRAGRIRVINSDGQPLLSGTNAGTMLDIRANVLLQGDGGLLSAAFPDDFATSGEFYVFYTRKPDFAGVLSRFHVFPGTLTADPASKEDVLITPRPNGHNGGWMAFSPVNGYLYLSLGDGGTGTDPDPGNRAQTITGLEFSGKILRLDVSGGDAFPADPNRNYSIPPSNPFVGRTGDDEIWSYGLRNPWRCGFDRSTGDLWIGDVGQDLWEEVQYEPAASPGGRNYGWRCTEGPSCTGLTGCTCNDPSLVPPLFAYDHTTGCSITGAAVYRGPAIPSWSGTFLYSDWCTGRMWTIRQSGGSIVQQREVTSEIVPAGNPAPANPVAICNDGVGELYVVDFGGTIFKLVLGCDADFDHDGATDFFDYDAFVICFEGGPCPPGSTADFDNDGAIDFFDYDAFVRAFEGGC